MSGISHENLQDGSASTGLMTSKFRVEGADGKTLLEKIMSIASAIAQADGTISAGDKADFAGVAAFLANAANFDKIVKKF